MIQPVNAFAPKVFKGLSSDKLKKSEELKLKAKKNSAIISALGISGASGVFTGLIARSYTASRKNALFMGAGASLITMMFICPPLLYKAGIYTHRKELETDIFSKKLLKK